MNNFSTRLENVERSIETATPKPAWAAIIVKGHYSEKIFVPESCMAVSNGEFGKRTSKDFTSLTEAMAVYPESTPITYHVTDSAQVEKLMESCLHGYDGI
jgi:hypothetical protein